MPRMSGNATVAMNSLIWMATSFVAPGLGVSGANEVVLAFIFSSTFVSEIHRQLCSKRVLLQYVPRETGAGESLPLLDRASLAERRIHELEP